MSLGSFYRGGGRVGAIKILCNLNMYPRIIKIFISKFAAGYGMFTCTIRTYYMSLCGRENVKIILKLDTLIMFCLIT